MRGSDLQQILVISRGKGLTDQREVSVMVRKRSRYPAVDRQAIFIGGMPPGPEQPKQNHRENDCQRHDDRQLAHGFNISSSRSLNARKRKFTAGEKLP